MNSDELVSCIRRVGQISPNDPVYPDTEILAEASQALRDRFAAPIMLCRQGFWMKETIIVTNNLDVAYKIPANTIVQGLEKVEIASPGTNDYRELFILTQAQAQPYRHDPRDVPTHFTLESDHVRLWPAPNGAYNLKLVFYLQPPELVSSAIWANVINKGSTFVEINLDPSTLFLTEGEKFYIQNYDGSHEIPTFDATIDTITPAGGTWILDVGGPLQGLSSVQIGDYVTPKGYSMFPMLPLELHRPLCDYVAGMIWVSKGDSERGRLLVQKGESGIARFVEMAVSRVKTKPFTWKRKDSFLRRHLGG